MSGRLTGDEYVRIAQDYIDSDHELPTVDNRTVSVARLSATTGIPTQSLYKNSRIRELINSAATRQGLSPLGGAVGPEPVTSPEQQPSVQASPSANQRLERHAHNLELQNAALIVENSEFRRKLKELVLQYGREDMTIDTGRRIADPRRFKRD